MRDRRNERLLFMAYVTDALRMIAKGGEYPRSRWWDVRKKDDDDDRDAQEIVDEVVTRIGLEVLG